MKNQGMARKIQRKRRKRRIRRIRKNRRQPSSSSESTSSFPLDLTSEILSKLPAKSVQRFRCVSKLWSSITTDSYFINKSFETHSSTRPRLLVCFRKGDKLFVFSISQPNNQNRNKPYSISSSKPIDSYHMTYPKHHCPFPIRTESVHGLILFQESPNPMVWNPSLRKFFPLPKPGKSWKGITVLLGYDPIERKHKVVCMPVDKTIDECRVLTLGSSQEQWRKVETNHNHCPLVGNSTKCTRCVDGILYYRAKLGSDRVIMSFDVRSEKFDVITLPWGESWRMMMMSYQGKLACVGHSNSGNRISMWVLEDATKHEWSNHLFLPLSQYGPDLQNQFNPSDATIDGKLISLQIFLLFGIRSGFKLIGMTDDGELIYGLPLLESLVIIVINPKRQTIRRIVVYSRGVDDDFRQRNGLGERRPRELQIIPNHIETLLSL